MALATLDADGNGELSFSVFYNWYSGASDCYEEDADGMSAVTTPRSGMRSDLSRDDSESVHQAALRRGRNGGSPVREAYTKVRLFALNL